MTDHAAFEVALREAQFGFFDQARTLYDGAIERAERAERLSGELSEYLRAAEGYPLRKSEAERALRAASQALRSYQHGNSATELAKEIADACDAVLAKVPS